MSALCEGCGNPLYRFIGSCQKCSDRTILAWLKRSPGTAFYLLKHSEWKTSVSNEVLEKARGAYRDRVAKRAARLASLKLKYTKMAP